MPKNYIYKGDITGSSGFCTPAVTSDYQTVKFLFEYNNPSIINNHHVIVYRQGDGGNITGSCNLIYYENLVEPGNSELIDYTISTADEMCIIVLDENQRNLYVSSVDCITGSFVGFDISASQLTVGVSGFDSIGWYEQNGEVLINIGDLSSGSFCTSSAFDGLTTDTSAYLNLDFIYTNNDNQVHHLILYDNGDCTQTTPPCREILSEITVSSSATSSVHLFGYSDNGVCFIDLGNDEYTSSVNVNGCITCDVTASQLGDFLGTNGGDEVGVGGGAGNGACVPQPTHSIDPCTGKVTVEAPAGSTIVFTGVGGTQNANTWTPDAPAAGNEYTVSYTVDCDGGGADFSSGDFIVKIPVESTVNSPGQKKLISSSPTGCTIEFSFTVTYDANLEPTIEGNGTIEVSDLIGNIISTDINITFANFEEVVGETQTVGGVTTKRFRILKSTNQCKTLVKIIFNYTIDTTCHDPIAGALTRTEFCDCGCNNPP